MYQHKHLDGATARGAFRADDRYCEDQLPHVLPSAIYVSTSGLYIYESQSGRAQGYSKQSAVAGARAPLMARQTGNKPLTTTKTDESAGRYLYDECMAARGWIVRDDAETGETAEGAASRAPR